MISPSLITASWRQASIPRQLRLKRVRVRFNLRKLNYTTPATSRQLAFHPLPVTQTTQSQTSFLTSSTLPSAIGTVYPCIPIPTPSSLLDTLASLEESIGREQWERFCRRLENGFDFITNEIYNSWKAMIMQIERQNAVCPCKSACSCSCQGIGFCDCGSVLSSRQLLLIPPAASSVREHMPSPRHLRKASVTLCLNQCGRSARGNIKGTKLNPGNQSITGMVFLDVVNSEKERKRREKERMCQVGRGEEEKIGRKKRKKGKRKRSKS